jgi:hypothetical protein
MKRRVPSPRVLTLAPLFAAAALALAAPGARGQVNFGIHVARATKTVNGAANGLGASFELKVPIAPVDVMVAGEYFWPQCRVLGPAAGGCSYMGGGADLHFALPFPVLHPYALGGVVVRRSKADRATTAVDSEGLALGVGVNLRGVALGAYGELRYEWVAPAHPVVFRVGFRF